MGRINNKDLYNFDQNISDEDFVIGSDADTPEEKTKNYKMKTIRDYLIAGLSPDSGGTLKITEITTDDEDITTPEGLLNSLLPSKTILRYEVVVVNVHGKIYLFKTQDITVGAIESPVAAEDFILIHAQTKLGDGQNLIKGYNETTKEIEHYALKSLGLEISVEGGNTGNILIERKAGVNLSETGVSVYNGRNNTTKLDEFYVFDSLTLLLTKNEETGKIFIEVPNQDFSYLTSFYVNSNYTSTPEAPSDGSIIRPFENYEDAKQAFIGNGSVHAPQFSGAKIVLQTSSTVSINPSVNDLILEFENDSVLSYTGNDDYMFDTEVILASSGQLPENTNIYMQLTGIGGIVRTGTTSTKVGLVRGMGSNRGVTVDLNNPNISRIAIAPKDSDIISLMERQGSDYNPAVWAGDITYPNGVDGHTGETLESFYGYPHKYSLSIVPTQPLVYMDHRAFVNFGYPVTMGGTVKIITLINKAIYAGSNTLLITGRNIVLSINGQYISTTSATKLISNPYVYEPHADRSLIETYVPLYINGGTLKYDGIGEYNHNAINSFIQARGTGFNVNSGIIEASGVVYVENFIDFEPSSGKTSVSLKSNFEKSSISLAQGQTFINTDEEGFIVFAPNTDINTFQKLTPDGINGIINTAGTVSTYNSKPIQTLPEFSSIASAKASGLTVGSVFTKVTNVNADDLQAGVEYKITTVGSPSLGTLGDYFTATGTETGTGVGTLYEIKILI